jgi:hypothetical protein
LVILLAQGFSEKPKLILLRLNKPKKSSITPLIVESGVEYLQTYQNMVLNLAKIAAAEENGGKNRR